LSRITLPIKDAQTATYRRRFFKQDKDISGLRLQIAKRGVLVIVLVSKNVPYIIRPTTTELWQSVVAKERRISGETRVTL
jgi:hypothetical protein